MRALRAELLTVLTGVLLLAAQSSLAQTRLGITAVQRAGDYRAFAGKRLSFVCPATDGVAATLYGTDTYTEDSPICAAAIHAGALKAGQAGVVSIDVGSGAKEFRGSQRNGLTSRSYGASSYSYAVARDGVPGTISWTTVWNEVPADFAEPITVTCPAGGTMAATIWGTDVYTIDSGICVAAVHAGVITPATGGSIAVRRARAPAQYAASDRNGVQSKQWGSSRDAFSVAAAARTTGPAAQPCTQGVATTQEFDAMKASVASRYDALIAQAQSNPAQVAALTAQRDRLLVELESLKQENLRAFCPSGPRTTQNTAPPAETGPSRIDTSRGGAGATELTAGIRASGASGPVPDTGSGALSTGAAGDAASAGGAGGGAAQPSVPSLGSVVQTEPLGGTFSAEAASGSVATPDAGANGRIVATPTSALSTAPPPVATAPTGFTARVLGSGGNGGAVALSWQPVTGALKYRFEGPAIVPEGLVVAASSSGVTLNDVPPGPNTWRMAAVYENDFWDRDKIATASAMVRVAPPRSTPWLSKYGVGTAGKATEHYLTVCPGCAAPGIDWETAFLPLLGGLGARIGIDCTDGFGLESASYGDCGEASYVNVTDFGTTRATGCFALNAGGILCYAKSDSSLTAIVQRQGSQTFFAFNPGPNGTFKLTDRVTVDSEGPKFLPNVCLACHGGNYNPATGVVSGSTLLPLDPGLLQVKTVTTFENGTYYPHVRSVEWVSDHHIRPLNQVFVQNSAAPAVGRHLRGIYGVTLQGPANLDYVPQGWASQAGLYRQVVRPYCVMCHLASTSTLDVSSFDSFFRDRQRIHAAVCAAHSMPHAEVPFNSFWTKDTGSLFLPGLLATTLGYQSCP